MRTESQTIWRAASEMGPKKKKVSRWQPLPEGTPTFQSTTVPGIDDHTVKVEELPLEDLENCLKFIEQSNKTLTVENTFIERYLMKMDPACLVKMEQILEAAAVAMHKVEKASLGVGVSALSLVGSPKSDDTDFLVSTKSTILTRAYSQVFTNKINLLIFAEKGPKVQQAHKIEMIDREIEEMRNALDEFKEHVNHVKYIYRCRKEELTIRQRGLSDSRNYFENKLLVDGTDPLTGKLPGEKFIRYLETKLQSEDSEIDKIRVKTSSVRNQLKRVEQQLAQKAELGEVLHAIDFEQIKIENRECQERLDEKILDLIDIKKMSGSYGTILNFNLKKLQEQVNRLNELQKDILTKQKMIEQLRKDEVKVNNEVAAASKSVRIIRHLMNSFMVPEVWDYILQKAEVHELKKDIKICERKLKLKDLALAIQAQKLRAKMDQSLAYGKSLKKFSHFFHVHV